jgi:hypothetical protein
MGFYDDIDKEQAAGSRGEYARAGNYLFLITRLRSGTSKKDSSDYAAFDGIVLAVLPGGETPMIVNPATGNPKDWVEDPRGHNVVGEEVSISFMRKWQSARRNFKAFIANAVGVPPSEITPSQCQQVEDDQLLAGEVVQLKNTMTDKKDGAPFTKTWCVRRVEAAEYAEVLDPAVIERFFPEGIEA